MNNKRNFGPKKPTNPALMYINEFQAKDGSGPRNKYKLIIRGELLAGLEPDEKGNYTLIGFPNDYKQADKDPDVRFKADEPKPQQGGFGGKATSKPAARPVAKRAPVPQVEESEEDGGDEGEDDGSLPF